MKWSMKNFVSLPKPQHDSIYGPTKVTKINKKNGTTQTHVGGKSVYIVENSPDNFVNVLKVANIDLFQILANCG